MLPEFKAVLTWQKPEIQIDYNPIDLNLGIIKWVATDSIFRTPYLENTFLTKWMGQFCLYHHEMVNRGATAIIALPFPFPTHILLPERTDLNPTQALIHAVAVPENIDLLLHQPLEQVTALVAAVTTAHRHITAGTRPELITNQETIEHSVTLRLEELMHVLTKKKADPNKKIVELLDQKLGIYSVQERQLAFA